MGGSEGKLLKQIDQGKGHMDKEVDRLFELLDKDKSGVLEGAEYTHFMDAAYKYMEADFKKQGHHYDEATVRKWLKQWIDADGDGRITRHELRTRLKAVLDAGEG